MKKILLTLIMTVVAAAAWAQGTVNFANIGGGAGGSVNARIFDVDGTTPLSGSGYRVDLYYGAAGVSDASSLTALGANVSFNTGAQAGYFTGGSRALPFAGGTTVTLQVRAWRVADGATYEAAVANNGARGASNLIQFTLGTPPATPLNMVGLQSFALVIPEPSTYALGALGIGALLMVRRRKV